MSNDECPVNQSGRHRRMHIFSTKNGHTWLCMFCHELMDPPEPGSEEAQMFGAALYDALHREPPTQQGEQ